MLTFVLYFKKKKKSHEYDSDIDCTLDCDTNPQDSLEDCNFTRQNSGTQASTNSQTLYWVAREPHTWEIQKHRIMHSAFSRSPQRAAQDHQWEWSNYILRHEPEVDVAHVRIIFAEAMAHMFGHFLAFLDLSSPSKALEELQNRQNETRSDKNPRLTRESRGASLSLTGGALDEIAWSAIFDEEKFLQASPQCFRLFLRRVLGTTWWTTFFHNHLAQLFEHGPGLFEKLSVPRSMRRHEQFKEDRIDNYWSVIYKAASNTESRHWRKRIICIQGNKLFYASENRIVSSFFFYFSLSLFLLFFFSRYRPPFFSTLSQET